MRLVTKVLNLLELIFIYCRTKVDSVQQMMSLSLRSSSRLRKVVSSTPTTAATNYLRGIVTGLIGVTLDLATIKEQRIFPVALTDRMCITAP